MEITEVTVRKAFDKKDGKVIAYVTLAFDNCFVVHNIKIIKGKSGTFVAMPSRLLKTGEYKDVVHPITTEFRNEIQQKILDKYTEISGDKNIFEGNRYGKC